MLTGRRDHAAPLLWGVQSISSSRHIDATGVERLDSKLISVAFSKRSVATAARHAPQRRLKTQRLQGVAPEKIVTSTELTWTGEPQPVASGLTSAADPLEAGILEDGVVTVGDRGTGQGSARCSP